MIMKLSNNGVIKPPSTNEHTTMPFGKYKGWLFENIPEGYLKWALENLDFSGKYAWLEKELQNTFDEKGVK